MPEYKRSERRGIKAIQFTAPTVRIPAGFTAGPTEVVAQFIHENTGTEIQDTDWLVPRESDGRFEVMTNTVFESRYDEDV